MSWQNAVLLSLSLGSKTLLSLENAKGSQIHFRFAGVLAFRSHSHGVACAASPKAEVG